MRKLAIPVAFTLVIVACGGGTNSSTSTTLTASTTTATSTTTTTTTTTIPPTTTTTEALRAIMPIVAEVAHGFFREADDGSCVTVPHEFRDVTFVAEGAEVVVEDLLGNELGRATLGKGQVEENVTGLDVCRFYAEVESLPLVEGVIYRLVDDDGLTVGRRLEPLNEVVRNINKSFLHYPFVCHRQAGGTPAGLALLMLPAELYCKPVFAKLGQVFTDIYLSGDAYTAVGFYAIDVPKLGVLVPFDGFIYSDGTDHLYYIGGQLANQRWTELIWTPRENGTGRFGDTRVGVVAVRDTSINPWGNGVADMPASGGETFISLTAEPEAFRDVYVADGLALFIVFGEWDAFYTAWTIGERKLHDFFPFAPTIEEEND